MLLILKGQLGLRNLAPQRQQQTLLCGLPSQHFNGFLANADACKRLFTSRRRARSLLRLFWAEPPHIILRKGLIQGLRYSTLAADMGTYLARTLFFSSSLHLTGPQIKDAVRSWSGNSPMCELTEKVGAFGWLWRVVHVAALTLDSALEPHARLLARNIMGIHVHTC